MIRCGDKGSPVAIEKRGSLSISLRDGAGVHAYHCCLCYDGLSLVLQSIFGTSPPFFFVFFGLVRVESQPSTFCFPVALSLVFFALSFSVHTHVDWLMNTRKPREGGK